VQPGGEDQSPMRGGGGREEEEEEGRTRRRRRKNGTLMEGWGGRTKKKKKRWSSPDEEDDAQGNLIFIQPASDIRRAPTHTRTDPAPLYTTHPASTPASCIRIDTHAAPTHRTPRRIACIPPPYRYGQPNCFTSTCYDLARTHAPLRLVYTGRKARTHASMTAP